MAHVWNITDGNIYVSKNGNDTTGDGSKTNPYASINKATTVGANGNKIVIGTGVWKEARGSSGNIYYFYADGFCIIDLTYFTLLNEYYTGFILTSFGNADTLFNRTGLYRYLYNCIIKDSYLYSGLRDQYAYFYNCLFDNVKFDWGYQDIPYMIAYNCTFSKVSYAQINYGMNISAYDSILDNVDFSSNYATIVLLRCICNKSIFYNYVGNILNYTVLDPQFNNPLIGDYTLQPTSPCLFAGKNNATIGAFGLGYSFNPNSSVFTKEGGAVFSASSGTDDIVKTSQTINGIASYIFNLNAGKLTGNVESAWIDLQSIRYLLTTRLFANLIYNASGVATSRPDNAETAGEKAVYYDFEFKYCLTEADKATAAWKAVIWNKAVTIDNSNRGNADAAFVASEAKYISARFVKIKLYMREG